MARKREQTQACLFATDNETLRNPPRFGGFYDKDGYNGKTPSREMLRAAWDVVFHQRQPYYRRSSQLVDGDILSIDETHKVMKGVRVDGNKVFNGLFTILNQHNQVVGQVSVLGCEGKSLFFLPLFLPQQVELGSLRPPPLRLCCSFSF